MKGIRFLLLPNRKGWRKNGYSGRFFHPEEITDQVNAGDFPLLLLGIYFPPEKKVSFFAQLGRFYGKTFAGTGLTLLNGLQHFRSGSQHIGHRLPNEVFGTTTEMGKKRLVAKQQPAIGIDKRA